MKSLLEKELDKRFAPYPPTPQNRALKARLLKDLKQKVESLQKENVDYEAAVYQVMDALGDIASLIEGNRLVCNRALRLELMEKTVLLSILFNLLSLPYRYINHYPAIPGFYLLLLMASFLCFTYFLILRSQNPRAFDRSHAYLNYDHAISTRRWSWMLALLFIVAFWLFKGLELYNGPQTLNELWNASQHSRLLLALTFLAPLYTLIAPLIFSLIPKLILKYEVQKPLEAEEPVT